MSQGTATPYDSWEALSDDEITQGVVTDLLGAVPDDVWAAAACFDRLLDDTTAQQSLLLHGISRTHKAVERCQEIAALPTEPDREQSPIYEHFQANPADAQLCQLRSILLQRLDRLNSYVEMEKASVGTDEEEEADGGLEDELEEWEDDPWADEAEGTSSTKPPQKHKISAQLPISLSSFLVDDIVLSAQLLVSYQYFDAVRVLYEKHAAELWPFRLAVLDAIPEHAVPSSYRHLLPVLDASLSVELKWQGEPWRPISDFCESQNIQEAIRQSGAALEDVASTPLVSRVEEPINADQLSDWYTKQVDKIIKSTGIVDAALSIVQHGAPQGIPGLDELGEELSLLSRLIYDTPKAEMANDDFTLARWKSMGPEMIVRSYLAHSSPDTLAQDISRLVMPYLYVLEARAERAGRADPDLPNRLLYDYVLSIPLEHAAAVFEASKPTLPAAQRILRDDEDVARLALAILYGSDSLNEWSTMSRIFECMPAWDMDNEDGETDEEAADTTIRALGDFCIPSTSRPKCTAKDLLTFFRPLSTQALSKTLDILDIHLESGEILARWNVPAPLRWFLRSHADENEQRAWANRMSRRAGGSLDPLTTQEDWEWLLEDMLKLTEKNEAGLRGAFGLLNRDEVYSIYLGGLLSTGRE